MTTTRPGTTPTLAEIIDTAIRQRQADLRVSLPGMVTKFVGEEGSVDVQLMLRRKLEDEQGNPVAEDFPIIPNVPVAWPQSRDYGIFWPLKEGDRVLVVFSDYSLDQWEAKSRINYGVAAAGRIPTIDPADKRTHGLAGAVAFPTLYPAAESPMERFDADQLDFDTSQLCVVHKNGGLWVESTGTVYAKAKHDAPTDVVAMNARVMAELAKINAVLDELFTVFNAHAHTGVTTGPGSSGPPATPLSETYDPPANVGSTNLRAEPGP